MSDAQEKSINYAKIQETPTGISVLSFEIQNVINIEKYRLYAASKMVLGHLEGDS